MLGSFDVSLILMLATVVIVAQIVETVTGFGGTVIALSIGVHLVPVEVLVAALVLIGLLQSSWLVSRGRRHVDLRLLLTRILPMCGIGLIAGTLLFHVLRNDTLKVVLGAFVIVVAVLELWRLRRPSPSGRPLAWWGGGAVLLAGGVFHGLFASGGPMVVYYASRVMPDKRTFRATLSLLWLVLNTTLLVSYAVQGTLRWPSATLAGFMLPALLVGIAAGEVLHARVNDTLFRKTVQVVLLVTGVILVS